MRINNIPLSAIKDEFVTSLLNYYKIEESINLREHIADLVSEIKPSQYRDFFRRLSSINAEYKNSFEKIALVVKEFEDELITPLLAEAQNRTKRLYEIMYQIKRDITDKKHGDTSSIEIFENIDLATIKIDEKTLFDNIDMDVISNVGLKWIYDHVSYDRGVFESRVISEYKKVLILPKTTQLSSHKKAISK